LENVQSLIAYALHRRFIARRILDPGVTDMGKSNLPTKEERIKPVDHDGVADDSGRDEDELDEEELEDELEQLEEDNEEPGV